MVLAAALAASEVGPEPARRLRTRDGERRARAERERFTQAELLELLGDMDPTPDEPAPALELPEPDFIRWEPVATADEEATAAEPPLAA